MTTHPLPAAQAALLARTLQEAEAAQARLQLVFTTIAAGAGWPDGVRLVSVDPESVTVAMPEPEAHDG